MTNYRHVLLRASTIIPIRHNFLPDEIQDVLAHRMAQAITKFAADYDAIRDITSVRSRAVVARAALEAMFRLLGALHSTTLAVRIIYSTLKGDEKKLSQMKDADPNPGPDADDAINDVKGDLDFLHKTYGDEPCKSLKVFDIANKVHSFDDYRTKYFSLSQYVHSSYSTLGPANPAAIAGIADVSVVLACCRSAEKLAAYYDHPEAPEIRSEARSVWSTFAASG